MRNTTVGELSAAGGRESDRGMDMRDKLIFFVAAFLTAVTVSAIAGGAAVALGRLVGMQPDAVLVLTGSAVVAAFTGVLALAGLAAMLLFSK
jgi:hypothetical protein